jgi:hypothetical protein
LKQLWLYVLAAGAVIGAGLVFIWQTIKTAKSRSVLAIKKAKIETDLFKKRQTIKNNEKISLAVIEENTKQELLKIEIRELEIRRASKKSKDQLVSVINSSFKK